MSEELNYSVGLLVRVILSYCAATLMDRCEGTRGAEGGDDAIHSSSATALETRRLP